jgi:acyl carrier protein phosphodiesterase
MNFLAHLYLSGTDEGITVGNFIADAVKGSHYKQFPNGIAKGILLHREIDHYTDNHPVVRASKRRLSPKYRIFSGIIVDIYYDHFLSKYWKEYSNEDLHDVVSRTYFLLFRKYHLLPARSKRILPFMVTQNWLVGYANFDSLQKVFQGMSRRTNHLSGMENAVEDLKENYQEFESEFRAFFPEITSHINEFRSNLFNSPSSIQH